MYICRYVTCRYQKAVEVYKAMKTVVKTPRPFFLTYNADARPSVFDFLECKEPGFARFLAFEKIENGRPCIVSLQVYLLNVENTF